MGWAPVEAMVALRAAPAGPSPVDVSVRSAGSFGRLIFEKVRSDRGTSTLHLKLPRGGNEGGLACVDVFAFLKHQRFVPDRGGRRRDR